MGGGSVELISGTGDRLLHSANLKLGAIRLKDQFLTKAPPTKSHFRDMQNVITREMQAALRGFGQTECDRIVASSGTAANLAEIIDLERTGCPIPQINRASLTSKEIGAVEQALVTSDVDTRLTIPGLDPRRVDT